MRVLIFTSSGGTAHDAAAGALGDWLRQWDPGGEVGIEQVLENGSGPYRGGVALYNWIQKHAPWLHQAYWCLMEFEDLIKPGTVLFGRRYLAQLLLRFRPDLIISTHPHTNRGHFAYAKRLLGPQLRCLTCCTELAGGFGFSRNWISASADAIWVQTAEVAAELKRRHYPPSASPCWVPSSIPPTTARCRQASAWCPQASVLDRAPQPRLRPAKRWTIPMPTIPYRCWSWGPGPMGPITIAACWRCSGPSPAD